MDYEDLLYSPKISGKNKPRGKADAFQASLGHKRRYPNTCDSDFDFLFFAIAKARVGFYFDNSMILHINGYLELSV